MADITLTILGREFSLLALYYKFHRDIDLKGRPETPLQNGFLYATMESTEDTSVFEQFVTTELNTKPFSGKIEVLKYWDETVIRRLVWNEAYIIKISEKMDCFSVNSMVTEIMISPIDLAINDQIYFTRHRDKTPGYWLIDSGSKTIPMRSSDALSFAEVPKKPNVLITAVNGKKEAYPNEKVTYTVTSYSSTPTDTDRERVSWIVQVEDKRFNVSQRGEEIILKIKEDWVGKEILVMAYLESPLETVSQKTKIKLEAVIVFVNGYWNSGDADSSVPGYSFLKKIIAENVIGSYSKEAYWGSLFISNSKKYFERKYKKWTAKEIEKTDCIFIDGSSSWNSSGKERWNNGCEEATNLIETELKSKDVINDEKEQQKLIFFVSHSMGAAHAEGMICSWGGYPYNWKIDGVLHFSPADNRGFSVKLPSATWEINILPDPVLAYKNLDDTVKSLWKTILEKLGKSYTNENPHGYQIIGLRKDHFIYIYNHGDYLNHAYTKSSKVWTMVPFLTE